MIAYNEFIHPYEQEGNIAEAVQHALRAHAWERAADLLESLPQTSAEGTPERQLVTRWVEQLPAEVVRSRPQLGQLSVRGLTMANGQSSNELWLRTTEMGGRAVHTVGRTETAGTISFVRDELEHRRGALLASCAPIAGYSEDAKADFELLLLDPLSEREREVLRLVAQGASNAEISAALVVEVNTVKRHMGNIMSKLQARNRTQAVAQARTLGLLVEVA